MRRLSLSHLEGNPNNQNKKGSSSLFKCKCNRQTDPRALTGYGLMLWKRK